MNEKFVQGLAVVIAAIGIIASAGSVSADQPAHDYHIALGDSIAAGEGATVPDQFGYVGVFDRFYRATNRGTERFANLAVGAETSSSFHDGQLARALEQINDPGTRVQVVTLTIGANDFLPLLRSEPCASDPTGLPCQQRVGNAISLFASNYQDSLTRLKAALAQDPGEGRILVTTYYNQFDGTGDRAEGPVDGALLGVDGTIDCASNLVDARNIGLNDIISCVGGQLGAEIVDIYPLFSDAAPSLTHITDGNIHPNNRGHREIGDAVIAVYHGG